jgi:cation-transporting ATPase 13A2
MKRMREMARFSCSVNVLRSGVWRSVSSEDLVPGDVFEVSNDAEMFPCDAILLSGDCIVNESMLTGESVPVSKAPATAVDLAHMTSTGEINSKFYLFNGTKIIRVRQPASGFAGDADSEVVCPATAFVVRTGFGTTKGGLVRSMLFPKPNNFKFYADSFKFIGVLAFLGIPYCKMSAILILSDGRIHIFIVPLLPQRRVVDTNASGF